MERGARRPQQFAALFEVHAVVRGAAVERALARRHQATSAKAGEMIRDQALRSSDDATQFLDLAITPANSTNIRHRSGCPARTRNGGTTPLARRVDTIRQYINLI